MFNDKAISNFIREYVPSIRLHHLPEDMTNMAFGLVVMNGFFLMFRIDIKLTVLLVIVSSLVAINQFTKRANFTYSIWLLYVFHCILTMLLNSYRFDIMYYAMRYQFWGMIFFTIGISRKFANDRLIRNMRLPIFFACLMGFYLYFFNPSWYNSFRYARVNEYTSLDFLRFSSFWSYSYVIAYLSGIYSTYCLVRIIKGERNSKVYVCYIIAIIAVVLSQQRAVMGFAVLAFFYGNIYLFLSTTTKRTKNIILLFDVVLIIVGFFFINTVMAILDDKSIIYATGKIESMINADDLVVERVSMFDRWLEKPFPIFGDGFGRYSHAALDYNLPSITDCEYLKIIHETGVVGTVLFLLIMFCSLGNAFKHYNTYLFEIMVVIMYGIAMIGADPISSDLMQPWFFWFCLGRLNNPIVLLHERSVYHYCKL